jgi:DNA transposition AAA+ family ATPase
MNVPAIQKQQITESLRLFCQQKGSQNKASNALNGVSAATISQILAGKVELVADDMWRNIESQIKASMPTEWVLVETRDFKALTRYFMDAQLHSNVFAIVGDAGSGKSKAIEQYSTTNENVFRLSCSEFWNKKYFLQELLQAMGRDCSGLTVSEMMHEAVTQILKKNKPVIILDEADKLTDQVLYFFITLYNKLEDRCGIVLCATDHLDKRIKRGLKINKKGYKEIFSRIGRKCIELKGVGFTDVAQVCMANGIDDKAQIKNVWDDCEFDLRRVKRKIHALKQKNNGSQEN